MADSSKDQQPPKIIFPCDYSVRILGASAPDFKDFVIGVIEKYDPFFDGNADVKPSRTGKYLSVKVVITATGVEQLTALNKELKASGRVQMVL